jgi:hypothetical protein
VRSGTKTWRQHACTLDASRSSATGTASRLVIGWGSDKAHYFGDGPVPASKNFGAEDEEQNQPLQNVRANSA